MAREQQIVQTLVELADTTTEDFDAIEFLHRLTERCVQLLDCAEAGVLLADAAGRLMVMGSSSERSEALELLQSQNAEGPCFECFRSGTPVVSHDLVEDHGRWPIFASAASRHGFRSVQTVPMRVRGETIGALNLFRTDTGAIFDRDVPLAQGLADIAAIALTQDRSVRRSHDVVDRLQDALQSRIAIEQAKGVLAERAQIGVDVAFVRMRDYARRGHHPIRDVAADILDGTLTLDALTAAPAE